MEEAHRSLNPWTLHLQKLALELKCALCLRLFNRPVLLPCDHILCRLCIPKSAEFGLECPVCKHQCVDRDVKALPFMENIVNIYRNLDATFNASLLQPVCSDAGRVSARRAASFKKNAGDNSRKELVEIPLEGNSSMDGNCSYPSSGNGNAVKDSAKRPVEDGSRTDQELNSKYNSGAKCRKTNVKRQKKRSNGFEDKGLEINDPTEFEKRFSGGQSSVVMDPLESKSKPCAFCHYSEHTEGSGTMLSYANGKQIVGNVANFSKVIYVHEKCIAWTPRIFFKDGIIQNLDSEIARANKLKCSSCGKKGAGLGCYVESCPKTYHVPCAYNILDCRWDCDEYLLLCPKHESHGFPREQKSPKKRVSSQLNPCTASSNPGNNLVFCGSALSTEEKSSLVEFARTHGAVVSKFWRAGVTHVIAATDSNGVCTRTMKILMAILTGKWVLTTEWVKACMEAGRLVNEEPYEVKLDNHGRSGGPKAGRQRVLDKAPKLFDSLNFYFTGDFAEAYKNDLVGLVTTAGGNVVESKDQLLVLSNDLRATIRTFIVYNAVISDDCLFEDEDSIKSQRMAQAEDIGQEIGSNVVGHTWILESVAACSLLSMSYGV